MERSLNENDRFAAELRHRFEAASLLCLNVISSRGSGKTTLLERTLRDLPEGARAAVLTDDIKTDTESRRIARAGHIVKPMSIGGASHLDAARVTRALDDCQLDGVDFLFIENVGTLDRASGVDLGEHAKIVLLSVTEADDTPGRFPDIYRHAGLALITKSDLLAGVEFNVAHARAHAQRIHPGLRHIVVSCRSGEGLSEWQQWLTVRRAALAPMGIPR